MSSRNDASAPDSLQSLHEALTEALAQRLREGEDHVTKDGEKIKVSASAATLREVREWLKQNGIEANGVKNAGLRNLASNLPFE